MDRMNQRQPADDWDATLRAFTHRNAGRRTILEIDAPEVGAQEEETDYPFWGASWDPRDHRIQIMLGEQGSTEQHLTHSIEGAREIGVLRDDAGRDRALRVVHDGGQTLLRFVEY
jgi:hypothetical protein